MADFGASFGDIGSGIAGIFGAQGSFADAKSLDAAAGMEDTNAKLAKASGEIQETAAKRDVYKVMGGQASDVAHAGFQMSGSALDLARDSAQQGSITEALIADQSQIDQQGYAVQAASLRSQASSARSAGQAGMLGGVLNIATGVLGLFSDERLKVDLKRVGTGKNGLPRYSYRYRDDPTNTNWVGYLAQDVEQVDPSHVIDLGLKLVDSEYAPEKTNA